MVLKKKAKAITLGSTANMTFAVANVLMGIKKHSPGLEADCIIFHNDFSEKDMDLLNKIVPCRFINYEFPVETTQELENSSFGRYSKLAFSRYECFRMLDVYNQVLWIDIDVLVQKDISGIFDYKNVDIALYKETAPLQECFSVPIKGYNMQGRHYNSGVLLLNHRLKNYNEIADWLYAKTIEYGQYLKYADQGVINLLLQEFKPEVADIEEKFNCHPTKKSSKQACIVHSYSPQKFWKWYERAYKFREWDENYKEWLKMGGSPYEGLTYRPVERWCKAKINHDCPNPLRHPSKFIKFLLKN